MAQNQNDQRNQQPGKTNQPTQDGKNKETNPNNPTAGQSTQQGSQNENQPGSKGNQGFQTGNQQRQGAGSTQGRTDADVEELEEDETTKGEKTTGDSDSKRNERGTGNQNSQKGSL